MGAKFKYYLIGLFLLSIQVTAQKVADFQTIDSLTYKYYISGEWNKLIKLGSEALDNGVDYKYLRQRLGFACFSNGDYIKSGKHFEKALSYDGFDTFTLTYLYYSYLNSGKTENAALIAGKMPADLEKRLSVRSLAAVESIDLEYNFKYSGSGLRSNPQYFHLGINSRIGSQLELYQMFSYYTQTFTVQDVNVRAYAKDRQPEYYALVKYTLSTNCMLKSAYHYLNPTYDTITSSAHLGYLELSADFGRFNFAINTSFLKGGQYSVYQSGVKAGVAFTGNLNLYFNGALSFISKQNAKRLIYNQATGFEVFKNIWIEGNITLGDMTDYHDHDAMYVYNLIDPTTVRAGSTIYFYSGKHLTLWTNWSYERKEYNENNLYHYNQFSYLGGVKWKL